MNKRRTKPPAADVTPAMSCKPGDTTFDVINGRVADLQLSLGFMYRDMKGLCEMVRDQKHDLNDIRHALLGSDPGALGATHASREVLAKITETTLTRLEQLTRLQQGDWDAIQSLFLRVAKLESSPVKRRR